MTTTTSASVRSASGLQALILGYNGFIGRHPRPDQWISLAALAGWPAEEIEDFKRAFSSRRDAYNAGAISTHVFWAGLLRSGATAPPGSALLQALRAADVGMWTATDTAVLEVLRSVHACAGIRMVLLSNAPAPLGDALDREEWCATFISKALYSARLGCIKPHERAYQVAMAAAGWPEPMRTLFIDAREDNCAAAAGLGLRTLHYTGDTADLARQLPHPKLSANAPTVAAGPPAPPD